MMIVVMKILVSPTELMVEIIGMEGFPDHLPIYCRFEK